MADSRNLTAELAMRLLGARENRFARFVTWVSFVGLTLGVSILTVVVTVMNGFDHELKQRLLQAIPHVTIAGVDRSHPVFGAAQDEAGVVSVHEYFNGIGAITKKGVVRPVRVYGADADGLDSLDFVAARLNNTSFAALQKQQAGILLGAPIAASLRLRPGDPLTMVVSTVSGDLVVPKPLRFNLVGTFELGADPDYDLAIVNFADRSRAAWSELGETGLQIQLADPLLAESVTRSLLASFDDLQVSSWAQTYGELFEAVKLEKSMMFVLLLLVVAIAAFNIVAGQVMTVSDKASEIAILRTMGASEVLIRNVFLSQGALISIGGTALGLILGIVLALNINGLLDAAQAVTGMHLLDGSFFVEVPILILPSDLLLIAVMSGTLCLLSALLPARRAAQINPVLALHN